MEIFKMIPTNEWIQEDLNIYCPVCGVAVCMSPSRIRIQKLVHQGYHEDLMKLITSRKRVL